MAIICPSCGSEDLTKDISLKKMPIPFGTPAEWSEAIYHCNTCAESGDFADSNDKDIQLAIDTANKLSINNITDELAEFGVKMAYLERSLELPARTVAKWKSGSYSASAVALLRTIRTFPWILEVADSNFDQIIASKILCREAWSIFQNELGNRIEVEVSNKPTSVVAKLEYSYQTPIRKKNIQKPLVIERNPINAAY